MKNKALFALIVVLALSLCGCATRTVDQMYKQPRRSSGYNNLQTVIDRAMLGMEYASPLSGENQQTVQMADLNGDGQDECLVFAKKTSDKMLYILVFSQDANGDYRKLDQIECNGSSFERVEYADVDGNPGNDIVIGRRLNNQIMAIASVFSLASGQAEQIMSTVYSKCLTLDMDGDGVFDLFVIRDGEGERKNATAMIYSYRDHTVERSREADLSESVSHIRRITASTLSSGEPAVFISSDYADHTIVTDVFAVKANHFTNLTYSDEFMVSVETLKNYYLYSEDIDGDGVMEMPELVSMRTVAPEVNSEDQYLIRWYSIDMDGNQTDKLYTFHNYSDSWYMLLDNDLADRIAVDRNGHDFSFYVWNEDFSEATLIFSLYTLTGKDRDSQADEMNHFALYRGETVVYSAGLGMSASAYGITESSLTENFHLISQAWKNGDA